jgi:hypothetical protein
MKRILVAVALLTRLAHADAQPSMQPPSMQSQVPSQSQRQAEDKKSRAMAVALSAGVTAAGVGLLVAGDDGLKLVGLTAMFVGPSAGRWYAGDSSLIGYRALGLGIAALGVLQIVNTGCEDEVDVDCSKSEYRPGMALMLAGAGVWVGSSVADIVLADRSARRFNERHSISIAPVRFGTADGRATGIGFSGRF